MINTSGSSSSSSGNTTMHRHPENIAVKGCESRGIVHKRRADDVVRIHHPFTQLHATAKYRRQAVEFTQSIMVNGDTGTGTFRDVFSLRVCVFASAINKRMSHLRSRHSSRVSRACEKFCSDFGLNAGECSTVTSRMTPYFAVSSQKTIFTHQPKLQIERA